MKSTENGICWLKRTLLVVLVTPHSLNYQYLFLYWQLSFINIQHLQKILSHTITMLQLQAKFSA